MAIVDGQDVAASPSNAAWASKTQDNTLVGKQTLNKPGSGAQVDDVQQDINTNKTNIASNTARITVNETNIATNVGNIAENTSDVADLRTLSGTADGDTDLGTFPGDTVSDNVDMKTALTELEAKVEENVLMKFRGNWDASTDTPTLAATTPAETPVYRITVAGTTSGLALIPDATWSVGDWIYFDGTNWQRSDNVDDVLSVNGKIGVIVLDTDDIAEGAALYFTELRVDNTPTVAANTAKVSADGSINTHSDVELVGITDGQILAYETSSGKFKNIDNEGGGGGSGTGSKNYSGNADFEVDASNVLSSNISLTFPVTAVAGEVVAGAQSLRLEKDAADRSGEFWTLTGLELDDIDKKSDLSGSVSLRTDYDASYVDESYELRAYDQAGARLSLLTENPLFKKDALGKIQFSIELLGTETRVDLRIYIIDANATAYNCSIDEIKFGPGTMLVSDAPKIAIIAEQQASGVNAGGSTSDTIHNRVLNTIISDPSGIVVLLANKFTLEPGDYKIHARAPHFFAGDGCKLFLHDGSNYVIHGNNDYAAATNAILYSFLDGEISIDVTTTFELRHYIRNGKASDGLGLNVSFGANPQSHETYSQIVIEKIPGKVILSTNEINQQSIRAVYEVSASTSNISFADNVSEIVDFDSKITDTHSAVVAGASWGFTAPASRDYLIDVTSQWSTNASLLSTLTEVFIDGVFYRRMKFVSGSALGDNSSKTVPLLRGQVLDIRIKQDHSAGGARTIETSLISTYVSILGQPDLTIFGVHKESSEYISTEVVGDFDTTTGDLWAAVPAVTLELKAGIEYDIGYDVSCRHVHTVGANIFNAGNVALFNNTLGSRLNQTIALSTVTTSSTSDEIHASLSRNTRFKPLVDTTLQLQIRSNLTSNGKFRVRGPDVTGTLTNPDNTSIIWARKVV